MSDHPLFTQKDFQEFQSHLHERTDRFAGGLDRQLFNYSLKCHDSITKHLGSQRLEGTPLPPYVLEEFTVASALRRQQAENQWKEDFKIPEGETPWGILSRELFPLLKRLKVKVPSACYADKAPSWFLEGLIGRGKRSVNLDSLLDGYLPYELKTTAVSTALTSTLRENAAPHQGTYFLEMSQDVQNALQCRRDASLYKIFGNESFSSHHLVIRCDPSAFLLLGTYNCDARSCMSPAGERRRNPVSLIASPETFVLYIRTPSSPTKVLLRAIGQAHFNDDKLTALTITNIYRRGHLANVYTGPLRQYILAHLKHNKVVGPNDVLSSSFVNHNSDLYYSNGDAFAITTPGVSGTIPFLVGVPIKFQPGCLVGSDDEDDESRRVYCVECGADFPEDDDGLRVTHGDLYCLDCHDETFVYSEHSGQYIRRDDALETYDGDFNASVDCMEFSPLSSPEWQSEHFVDDDLHIVSLFINGKTHYFHEDDPAYETQRALQEAEQEAVE